MYKFYNTTILLQFYYVFCVKFCVKIIWRVCVCYYIISGLICTGIALVLHRKAYTSSLSIPRIALTYGEALMFLIADAQQRVPSPPTPSLQDAGPRTEIRTPKLPCEAAQY
jgi:hypothetical protein